MNDQNDLIVSNFMSPKIIKNIRPFNAIRIVLLVVLSFNLTIAQAASQWIKVNDTPVIGDGNHHVYIYSVTDYIENLNNEYYIQEATLKEYYTSPSNLTAVLSTSYSYGNNEIPTSDSVYFIDREPGQYYYQLTIYVEDDTGEEENFTYTTDSVTVLTKIPDVPVIQSNSSPVIDSDYYVWWADVESADYYQVADRDNSEPWVYYSWKIDEETEVTYDDTPGVYSHKVRACNDAGCSDYSNAITVIVTRSEHETVSLPYSESFESGYVGWSNYGTKWLRDASGTPSSGTGPSKAVDGNYYMFMETTSGYAYSAGNYAMLYSPYFNASDATVSFNYHMYGSNMGTLYLEIYANDQWKMIWSRTGQQHTSNSTAWSSATVSLSAYSDTAQLRFRGVAAGGYRGDMAIDNVKIFNANEGRRRITYIHTDLLGSPLAETDEDGAVQGGQ